MLRKPISSAAIETANLRPAILDRDSDQDVLDISLGVFHEHIKIAIVVKFPVSSSSNSG